VWRLIPDRQHSHNLRSTTTTMCQPSTTTTFAMRPGRCSASAVWNSLYRKLCSTVTLLQFLPRDAMQSGTSHGPVSVCLSVSVTSRSPTKTAKHRITQATPHDSPRTLVFCCQRSPRNSTGATPYEGAECRWGGSKSATFDK